MSRGAAVVIVVTCTAAAGTAAAQTRERVTLVLGGGSARGIAHVGVLQWLDEHRVPVDLVVGTSMGGLMGGAFATGMTPAEMKELVGGIDWDRMFLGEAPYAVKTIRRKDDARRYPSRLRFGLKGRRLRPPGAIEPGQQINMLLQQIALPYYDLARFDDLPTPFRCVAVDVPTSEVVVLSDGPLWRALRATMAIPGVFSPVRVGDHVLVDGGVLANVPTEIARSLGPGSVIAINVGADPNATARTPAESYLGALMQTMDVMGSATLARSLRAADLAIRPQLDDIGSLDWRRSDLIIQRGYEAAESHRDALLRWSVGPAEYEEWRQARQRARRTVAPVPAALEIFGANATDANAIRRRFEPMLGQPLEAQALARELTAATGSDRYDTATADFVAGPSGQTMRVAMGEKGYGPPFLLTGLDVRNAGETQFEIDIRARLIAYDLLGPTSEVRLDFGLGTGTDAAAEAIKPLGGSRWFVGTAGAYHRTTQQLFQDGESVAEYRATRTGGGVDIGFEPSNNVELRLGYFGGNVDAEVRVGDPLLPTVGGAESGLRLRGVYDSMDSPMVPSRGARVRAELFRYFDTADIEPGSVDTEAPLPLEAAPFRGEIGGSAVRTVRRRDRVFLSGSGGTTFRDETYAPYDFTLGGMLRLTAYDPGELRGSNYFVGAAGYLLSLGRLPDFVGGGVYLSTWIETGSAFSDFDSIDVKSDAAAGLLAETFFGPVFLGASASGDGARAIVALAPLFW